MGRKKQTQKMDYKEMGEREKIVRRGWMGKVVVVVGAREIRL